MKKLLIFHNIATAFYKNNQFKTLYKNFKNFKVVHFAETEKMRDWDVDLSKIEYPFVVLFEGILENVSKYKLVKKSIKVIKEKDPEIIYIGGYSDIVYWAILIYGKIKRKKIILEMNSTGLGVSFPFIKNIIKGFFVKRCDIALTYSELSEKYLIKLGVNRENILIKPNITDNDWWSKKAGENLRNRDLIISDYGFKKKNIIYVGRFSNEKNIRFLIDAFIKSDNNSGIRQNEWGLILVGDGPQKAEIIEMVKNSLSENIYFVDFVQMEELAKLYCISDVLVLPSAAETWGIVINEAMASGLAIFSSKNVGASSILVKEKINGHIFDPDNIDELVKLFDSVLAGQINLDKMKMNSKKIIKEFNSDKASNKILEAVNLVRDL